MKINESSRDNRIYRIRTISTSFSPILFILLSLLFFFSPTNAHALNYDHLPPPSHLESVIDYRESTKGLKAQAFWFMDQIYGWCSHGKASILIDIITRKQPEKIVEIGVWGGKSLIPMAYALKALGKGKIYGIDPWDNLASIEGMEDEANKAYWGRVDHEAVLQGLIGRIDQFGLIEQVELIRATSADASPIEDIDILHIDGNHSDGVSWIDVAKWVPLVKSGGWIIVDDISWYENGHFTQSKSVEWLDEHCIKIAVIPDVCVWGIWVKR